MWPLTNGLRCLEGDEAGLFRGAVGMMVDQLVFELNDRDDPNHQDDLNYHEDVSDEVRGNGEAPGNDEARGKDEARDKKNNEFNEGPPDGHDVDIPLDLPLNEHGQFLGQVPLVEQTGELPEWLTGGEDNSSQEDHRSSHPHDSGSEGFGFETPHRYSMWEPEQKIWLLERVTVPLLTARAAPAAAAIYEATIEAVYVELADLIAMEITSGTPIEKGSWRGSLLDAYVQRCPKDSLLSALQFEATTLDPCLPPAITKQLRAIDQDNDVNSQNDSPEKLDWLNWWTMVIERLVDATFGPRIYHDAEIYRDGDPRELQRYLRTKGVNSKFIQRIPPLRSHGQTQSTIDRLQGLLFQT